jgi:hypothetical protein
VKDVAGMGGGRRVGGGGILGMEIEGGMYIPGVFGATLLISSN